MEKKKIVTSLTLAGILTAGVLGGNSNAASNSQGVCKNIISGESLVPYILENKDDFVTSARLQAEYTTASNLEFKYSDRVSTGDKFTTATGKKTVIVYGDVNQDGKVSTIDASYAQNIVLGNTSATNIQKAAADVRRNNNSINVTTIDASSIQEFVLNGGDYVNVKPIGEKDEAVEEGYTLVVGDNNIINTENAGTLQVTLKLDKTLEEEKTGLKVRVKDGNGTEIGTAVNAKNIPAHTDTVNELLNAAMDILAEEDGTYTFELLDGDKVLARTTVTKNTVEPAAAKVTTERTGWDKATLSFENSEENGETTNAKVYYVVLKAADANIPTKLEYNTTTKSWEFQNASNVAVGTTYSAETPNGKLSNKELEEKLEENTAYKVYYVLENTYGSRTDVSTAVPYADIKDGKQTGTAEAIDKTTIKAPDLKKGETDFTWTAKAGATYKIVVYKDGKIIKEDSVATGSYDISSDLNGAGKYKIEIITAATASEKYDSAPVMSEEVEVKALNKVTDIKFEVKQTGPVLTFKDSNATADVDSYTVNVYPYIETDKKYDTTATTVSSSNIEKNADGTWTAKLTLDPNKAYKAEIVVNEETTIDGSANTRLDIVESEKAEIVDFFNIVPASAYISNTDTTVKLNIASLAGVTIKGSKLSNYRVEAYKANASHLPTEPEFIKATCTTTVDGNTIIVGGLDQNTDYVFKLYASVNGNEGQSAYIYETGTTYIKTSRTNPEIKNKKVVKAIADAKTGTVYYDGANLLKVNGGDEIDLTDNYSTEFIATLGVISKLNNGDEVTLDGENIAIVLGEASSNADIDFAATVEDKVVSVDGKGYSCTLKSTLGNEAKEVRLSGNNSRYTVTGLNAEKITVNNGVVIAGNNTVNVVSGTATINGVKVTTGSEIEIDTTAASKELDVKVSGAVTNNLIFENLTDTNVTVKDAIINFVDDGTNKGQQLGTIVIKTNNGMVTVNTVGGVNVDSKLNVEVNKGGVDISDPALTGNKNISVTHVDGETDTVINVNLVNDAPFKTASTYTVELKQYELDEDVEDSNGDIVTPEDGKTMEDVVKFLNSFNLSADAKATLATTDGKTLTLTISGDVTNYTVPAGLIK